MTDYTHGYATYQPGSFHLTHGLQLPFLFPNSGVAALVSEELYPEYLKGEYERMGVYLAHCNSATAYDILSKTPVRTPADMRGLKVRSTGGLMAETLRQVDAIPVVLAAAEAYTAFSEGHHRCGRAGRPRHGGLSALRDRELLSADPTDAHGHSVLPQPSHLRQPARRTFACCSTICSGW